MKSLQPALKIQGRANTPLDPPLRAPMDEIVRKWKIQVLLLTK